MGTPLSRVYNKFLGQLDDKEWLLIDDDVIEDLMLDYLETATVDFTQCRKDLSFTIPERLEEKVTTNGLTSKVEFTPKEGEIATVVVINTTKNERYEERTDFTINKLDSGNMELSFLKDIEGELIIHYVLEGFFKEDLDLIEIRILAMAMLLSYIKPKIMTQQSLKQYVSDSDFSMLSGANMLLRLQGLKVNLEKEKDVLQARYAFMDFQGFN